MAEVPFLVVAVVLMMQGWRASQDDAVIAIRSWGVLTAHSPLLGQITQATGCSGHSAFSPGPLQYWTLAIPVRIDHAHGVLWGAALVAATGMAVCVEAAWAVRGASGALAVAAASVVFAATQPLALVNPIWNPYLGVVWFAASCMAAWAVGSGRLRWWPVLVVAASIAAQTHLEYAVPAVLLAVLAPLAGLVRGRPGPRRWLWLPVGLTVGAACWAAPIAQQVTSHPGNLTVLLRCVGRQPTLGGRVGLQALTSAVAPPPLWFHRQAAILPDPIHHIGQHSATVGMAILVALAAICVLAGLARRRDVAVLAGVALAAAASTVWAIAALPVDNRFQLGYLDVVLWPVGMLVWGVAALVAAALVGEVLSRLRRHSTRRELRIDRRGAARWVLTAAAAVLAGGVVNTVILGSGAGGQAALFAGGRGTFRGVSAAAAAAERVVPDGPLVAIATGPNSFSTYSLLYGTVWVLISNGRQASMPGLFGGPITPPVRFIPGEPIVGVAVRADGSVAGVVRQIPSAAHPSPR